jgi:hypothetical protein
MANDAFLVARYLHVWCNIERHGFLLNDAGGKTEKYFAGAIPKASHFFMAGRRVSVLYSSIMFATIFL